MLHGRILSPSPRREFYEFWQIQDTPPTLPPSTTFGYISSSDVFLQNYAAEDLKNDDEGYIRWAGELKLRERIMEDLNNLRDIEYVAS